MWTYECRFYPAKQDETFITEYFDDVRSFLSSLALNGMILEEGQNTVKFADNIACRLIVPEKDSLDRKNYNKYNTTAIGKLLEKSAKPPEFEMIGECFDMPDRCECGNPGHYVLFTEWSGDTSPVICGDCLAPVPLYRLPKTYDDSEYYDVLCWQDSYRACDTLFMKGMGERYAYRMIHSTKSMLASAGLDICRDLEKKTGKKFYYFLYDYYSTNKSMCPNCGKTGPTVIQIRSIMISYVGNAALFLTNIKKEFYGVKADKPENKQSLKKEASKLKTDAWNCAC